MPFLWPLVVAVIVLALGAATIRYVPPALSHHRHARALVHIAQMERELGVGPAAVEAFTDPAVMRVLQDQLDVAEREELMRQAPQPPVKRIYGQCALCKRRVTLNEGICQGVNNLCAKRIYRATVIRE